MGESIVVKKEVTEYCYNVFIWDYPYNTYLQNLKVAMAYFQELVEQGNDKLRIYLYEFDDGDLISEEFINGFDKEN